MSYAKKIPIIPIYEAEKVILRKIAKELEEFNAIENCEKIDLGFLIRACYETIQECETEQHAKQRQNITQVD